MPSQPKITQYLEERESNLPISDSVRRGREELGIDDSIWQSIKNVAKAIMTSVRDREPTQAEQMAFAREIEDSEPLNMICRAKGRPPRYFAYWIVHVIIRDEKARRENEIFSVGSRRLLSQDTREE
ncbi:hypothetical protein ABW20_dc0104594 [Dactylellina cionopaga]|nr:hypothetical protein ABW20_dc0104594 [Dactylellina cionopaga]